MGTDGVETIIEAVCRLERLSGKPCSAIVLDTLARVMAPDDENSAQDVGGFISRCDEIMRVTGAAVIVVHHSGKDPARGMRGSSALYAAADLVLQLDERKTITIAKNKDGTEGDLGKYRLRPVTLGHDDDGDEITSCVVDRCAGSGREPAKNKARLSPTERAALDMLGRLYNDGKARVVSAAEIDMGARRATACPGSLPSTSGAKSALPPGCVVAARRGQRSGHSVGCSVHWQTKAKIGSFDGWVWLTGQNRTTGGQADFIAKSRGGQSGQNADKLGAARNGRGGGQNGQQPYRGCSLSVAPAAGPQAGRSEGAPKQLRSPLASTYPAAW